MPDLKTYDLFISHAWRYNDDYYRLEKQQKEAPNYYWLNYSVSKYDPAIDAITDADSTRLLSALDAQIKPVNCAVILGGMYAAYSYWVKQEIQLALECGKANIAIYTDGGESMPQEMQEAAKEVVNWSTISIVGAVRIWSI